MNLAHLHFVQALPCPINERTKDGEPHLGILCGSITQESRRIPIGKDRESGGGRQRHDKSVMTSSSNEGFQESGLRQPASAARVFSSSLFAYLLVALGGYFVANATAEQVAGSKQGIVFNVVSLLTWLLAGLIGGFVGGYRSWGRGWITGFLVGLYTVTGLLALTHLLFASEGLTIGDVFLLLTPIEQVFLAALLALNIPACMVGGMLGDTYYRDAGALEDPAKHTLFQIPWWHCIWLCPIIPAVVMTNLILSGHLLVLGIILTWAKLIRLDFSESLLLDMAPIIGFIATAFGVLNLWDALSARSRLSIGRRFMKAIWGLLLLIVLVNAVWRIASSMLLSAIKG